MAATAALALVRDAALCTKRLSSDTACCAGLVEGVVWAVAGGVELDEDLE
jgi:hypothetical protein